MPPDNETPVVTAEQIAEAALRVFSEAQLRQIPHQVRRSLVGTVGRRLARPGPPPTLDELRGSGELATEHLWHVAFNAVTGER